ncbi:putative 60S ribosomal protein L35a-1 [Paratrimastix pyriformis]|uniref:60S ribosomal protein L35a-1 n=1 Tax=Paratrimastix pyriformis TaxID=342808 RepID=A0ABQ8UT20_9EUKA|nr:putative 60S ribosomal protein L35a-1 [Paratrimastix pyriformis]
MSRLHLPAVLLGFQRSKSNQYPNNALLNIDGVKDRDAAKYYLGKTVLFAYRVKKTKDATTGETKSLRIIRGKITRAHGNAGVVRARFVHNLPPHAFGSVCRVMLYPQRS